MSPLLWAEFEGPIYNSSLIASWSKHTCVILFHTLLLSPAVSRRQGQGLGDGSSTMREGPHSKP